MMLRVMRSVHLPPRMDAAKTDRRSDMMNKCELKCRVKQTGSFFFSRKTMRFFGDTMKNYSCSSNPIEIIDSLDNRRKVYALWRKTPVKQGLQETAYFDAITFKRVSIKR